jgi:hypothetical protein
VAEWRLERTLALTSTLRGAGVGVQSIAEWTPENEALVSYNLIKHALDLSNAEDISLVASLYVGKRLIWPG